MSKYTGLSTRVAELSREACTVRVRSGSGKVAQLSTSSILMMGSHYPFAPFFGDLLALPSTEDILTALLLQECRNMSYMDAVTQYLIWILHLRLSGK